MNSKHILMTIACAAALCGSVRAEAEARETEGQGLNWAMGEDVTFGETSVVSAEVGLAFDSKFMSYGLVDNNDPILTPSAALTFFNWVTLGVEAIFDTSSYGKRAGYRDHAFRYQELDPGVAIGHAFGPDDAAWLPTTVAFELGYMYESHPKVVDDDTQFLTFSVGLPDLWFEPTFSYERDIDRDDGTYLNLEIGHTFSVVEGKEEGDDDILAFRVSLAQGWGDKRRVVAYLPDVGNDEAEGLGRASMMDTCVKGELTWNITDGVSLGAYAAYYDYLFDSHARNSAKAYEATGSHTDSFSFVMGVSLAVAF